ncbi:ABC transporter ATP-binding protein [Ammoniphilus sp. YIM 78166]|uniref:ABC transporter ATP-binding protein n=1 Tax=Ammoniphilus sp. YIM 78166 TaxID=1644106 RepID=UPI0010702B3E|nr:ABC transporter ATP-binding protein [Ammoniphilus sp. YIM 78166]
MKDGQLWRQMLRFAKPYRRTILIAIFMAGLIVLAALARPYIIKIAIDDRINGIQSPMAAGSVEELKEKGLEPIIQWNHAAYARVKHNTDIGGLSPAQIIRLEDQHYMVSGWIGSGNEPALLHEGQQLLLVSQDLRYPATKLSESDLELFRQQDYTGLVYLGIFFLLTVVGASLLEYFQTNMLQYSGQRIIFDIREKVFRHLTQMHIGFFDRNPVGRIVTRVSHDVEALNQLYSQVIVNLVKEICILIGIVIIMLQLSFKLTLICFTVIPLLVVSTLYYKKVTREAQRYIRAVLSRLNSYLAENLSGMQTIQMFTREFKQWEKFRDLNEEHYRAGMRTTVINSIFNPLIGFLGNLALALIIWYGGKSVLGGEITFGIVYAFTHYSREFFQPLMNLADRFNQIQTALASSERIFEVLEEKPKILNKSETIPLPEKVQGAIQFDRVWFAYDEDNWVLKDLSFHIEPGETVAFVGATGAGKSSIIQLINRFYDIQKGSIQIDGIDIRDMAMEDLRKHIGIIQQDTFMFRGDVDFNIRLDQNGLPTRDIRHAAKALQADEFIQKLPNQYQTPLGEQGLTLSSGQQQLLSFLRAFVTEPDILILDEATAHIDTETEQKVQRAIRQVSNGRTTLIVAHRLSTIQHADKIIVLHQGRIREMGTHHQLMKKKGFYSRLYSIQNRGLGSASRKTL